MVHEKRLEWQTNPCNPLLTMKGTVGNEFSVGSITESLQMMAALASLNSLFLMSGVSSFSLFLFFSQEVAAQR